MSDISDLSDLCQKHGVKMTVRKTGGLRPPKDRRGGVLIFCTFGRASVLLKGIEEVTDDAYKEIMGAVHDVNVGGMSFYGE